MGRGQSQGFAALRTTHRQGRRLAAPWAFILHPGPHNSLEQLNAASPLQLRWIEGVFEHRIVAGSAGLRPIAGDAGWLVDDSTGTIAKPATLSSEGTLASWLPAPAAVLSWLEMRGACAAVSPDVASRILGPGARVITNGDYACEFGAAAGSDTTRRLILGLSSARLETSSGGVDELAVRQAFEAGRVRAGGVPQPGIGDAAYVVLDTQGVQGIATGIDRRAGCSVLTVLKDTAISEASLCGSGFGTPDDYVPLRELVRGILSGLEE